MGRFDGVLLASDFDNTLIYTEDALLRGEPIPPLPERNRQALTYFMAEGGRFAISTGRALAAFEKYAPLVPMNAPGVICNGAALYDFAKQEYLVSALLDADARQRGQLVLDRFPEAAVEAYHIDNVIHAVHPNAITRHHEHLTKVAVTEKPSLLDVPLPLGKLLFEASHETLEQIRDLAPESLLPSVRSLSVELSVNPNTLQKAYAELERRGLCYSVPGNGRFISPGAPEALRASRQALLRDVAEKTGQLAQAGIPLSDIVSAVTRAYNEAKQGGAT